MTQLEMVCNLLKIDEHKSVLSVDGCNKLLWQIKNTIQNMAGLS